MSRQRHFRRLITVVKQDDCKTMKIIETVEELAAIYGGGLSEASVAKVTNHLTPLYRQMIEASPFVALATVGPEGLDCSPRGDLGGVVRVIDERCCRCLTGAATTGWIRCRTSCAIRGLR